MHPVPGEIEGVIDIPTAIILRDRPYFHGAGLCPGFGRIDERRSEQADKEDADWNKNTVDRRMFITVPNGFFHQPYPFAVLVTSAHLLNMREGCLFHPRFSFPNLIAPYETPILAEPKHGLAL